jgi:GTPase Era involved in 16S rRNA processing
MQKFESQKILVPKTGQKSIFLGKKAQTLRFSIRGGGLVGWLA